MKYTIYSKEKSLYLGSKDVTKKWGHYIQYTDNLKNIRLLQTFIKYIWKQNKYESPIPNKIILIETIIL